MARKLSFHTGEFAKIVGVNKRTLHYYDEEGIFRPAHVEPNGYRSYSFQQFYPFYMLRHFRSMGLDLAEIKEYMEHRSPARLDALLTEQQAWLTGEMERLRHQMRIVRNQRALLAQAEKIVCGRVEEVERKAVHLILSENVRTLARSGETLTIERVIIEHLRYVAERRADAGFGIGVMISPEEYCVQSIRRTAGSVRRGGTSSRISRATTRTRGRPTTSCARTLRRMTCARWASPMRRASSRTRARATCATISRAFSCPSQTRRIPLRRTI